MICIYADRNRLYRGPRPTRAELFLVGADINLEVGWFEFFHGEARQEKRWCNEVGAWYEHRPMSAIFKPTAQELAMIVHQIKFHFARQQDVLVHCEHGQDRTGIVIAAWRIIVEGWCVQRAIREMFAMGFHSFPYGHWIPVLEKIKEGYR